MALVCGELAVRRSAERRPFQPAVRLPVLFTYDPNGADGQGTVTATLGSYSAMLTLDAGHKADGAIFNRFGILNVMKSADDPGQLWLDNVTINGVTHPFNSNPLWDERNNRRTYTPPTFVRDSISAIARIELCGRTRRGEIGGHTFRGDSRVEFNGSRMAYYGGRLVETLSLNQPLHADGKVGFRRV
jgi:hypothetical protein